jgi:hypothetical protein
LCWVEPDALGYYRLPLYHLVPKQRSGQTPSKRDEQPKGLWWWLELCFSSGGGVVDCRLVLCQWIFASVFFSGGGVVDCRLDVCQRFPVEVGSCGGDFPNPQPVLLGTARVPVGAKVSRFKAALHRYGGPRTGISN